MSELTIDSTTQNNTAPVDSSSTEEAASTTKSTSESTAKPAPPPPKDEAETVSREREVDTKDKGPADGASKLADTDKKDLDQQIEKYRIEARVGQKTIAEPNDLQDEASINTVDAKEIDDASKPLDEAMKRGKNIVTTAGRKAAGKAVDSSSVDEGVDVVGMAVDTGWSLADVGYGLANGGKELAPAAGFAVGALGVGAAYVGVFTTIGGAHQDAHVFNQKEGYRHGYSKGYAAGLYGEGQPERTVKPSDNSKKQTYDFAYRDGARRGYGEASVLPDEDKAAARMYVETKMADNNEDHLWGNTDVAGAYVQRAGTWYSDMLP